MVHLAVLVGRLDGTTLCLRADGPTMSVERLMAAIHDAEGIPPETQRLVSGCRDLRPSEVLSGPLPRVTLCLRLAGGKGGFGAMLRGKGLAAGQKKTTNFDACRDLNGVRLKAVNQERQVSEWRAKQQAKLGEKVRKQDLPPPTSGSPTAAFDLDGYYEANESARAGTASAVMAGLAAKRQREELSTALVEARAATMAPADASSTCDDKVRQNKAPRVSAPAAAPSAKGSTSVGAKWSALGELPSDDGSSSADEGVGS